MSGAGESSSPGLSDKKGQLLMRNGSALEDERLQNVESSCKEDGCVKQISPNSGGGARNVSPSGRMGSRNTSPSRQKVIKTKPRGLDEETVLTFGKAAHTAVLMEDRLWAMLPEDKSIPSMSGVGESSSPGLSDKKGQLLMRNGPVLEDERLRNAESSCKEDGCVKQISPNSGGGARNVSPSGRMGSRNTSPSRQKVIKTKPRGLDEETVSTFGKATHTAVLMEDRIWAMLPEDLLNEVLARVPPFTIFRLRSVCKRWNLILEDSTFLKVHAHVPSHGPCLLTYWRNSQTPQCSVFSLPLKTWYRIPFSFLPSWVFWLVGSSGGLVCFSGFDGLIFKALVCNPLMQTWRELPSMHCNQQRQLIMVVDRMDQSFKVIATGDIYGDKSLPTEIYDSKHDSWSLHQTVPTASLCSSKMAFCDSRLYLETLSPLGLMMYRTDAGHWEHIAAKFPRSLLDGYLVVGTQKRLFLVGRIGLYSTLQSMRIWELDHAKISWVEISRMPPKYFRSLLRLSAERFECFGQDNLICFTSWNQGRGLLYDVDKKSWSWIAGCAFQSYNSQVCFYEPRFDASVH